MNCRDQYFWAQESVGLIKTANTLCTCIFLQVPAAKSTISGLSILLFQPQHQNFPGQAFYCSSHQINNSQAQHFIVPATKSTIFRPSILLFQPQNQQFSGPAFYCSSHKINIFWAQNFIVPAAKSTFSRPRILL